MEMGKLIIKRAKDGPEDKFYTHKKSKMLKFTNAGLDSQSLGWWRGVPFSPTEVKILPKVQIALLGPGCCARLQSV